MLPVCFRVIVSLLLLATSSARAHGMVAEKRSFRPLISHEQRAAIHWKNGYERMVIAVNAEDGSSDAIWIVPIPAAPDQTFVTPISSFPRISGRDFRDHLVFREVSHFSWIIGSQPLYPFLLPYVIPELCHPWYPLTVTEHHSPEKVSVHFEVDRFGLHSEVIACKSEQAIIKYLGQKVAAVNPAQIHALAPYLGSGSCLVIAWLKTKANATDHFDHEGRKWENFPPHPYERWPVLLIAFPSPSGPYYPLTATKGSGEQAVSARLYLNGLVTPNADALDAAINSMKVHPYFAGGLAFDLGVPERCAKSLQFGGQCRQYMNQVSGMGGVLLASKGYQRSGHMTAREAETDWDQFTVVEFKIKGAPTKKGLLFSEMYRPLKPTLLSHHWVSVGAVCVLFLSTISGTLAGLAIHRQVKPYALLSLFHLFSIIGLFVAVGLYDRGNASFRKTLAFVIAFSGIYVSLSLALWVGLTWLTLQFVAP